MTKPSHLSVVKTDEPTYRTFPADPALTTTERFKANRQEAWVRATLTEAANITGDSARHCSNARSLLNTAVAQQPQHGAQTPTERDRTVIEAGKSIRAAIESLNTVLGEFAL